MAGVFLLAIKKKACTVVGRGEKSLLTDAPASELRLGREEGEGKSAKIIEGMSKKKK